MARKQISPPDGGYGWVITFAAFMVGVVLDGVCFSFGIFYKEFTHHFVDDSRAKIAWVGSTINGMYLSAGPIVNGLCNHFGCRKVAMVGSLIVTVSYILAFFSTDLDFLIWTFGVLGGLGFGLMYLPVIVMVGFYFTKRRALATGIAVCGSGIGGFIFPPLVTILIDYYSWKGACLIIAGFGFNGLIFGALLRPVEVTIDNDEDDDAIQQPHTNGKLLETKKDGENGVPAEPKKNVSFFSSMDAMAGHRLRNGSDQHHRPSLIKSCDVLVAAGRMRATCYTLPVGRLDISRRVDVSRPKFHRDAYLIGSHLNVHTTSTENKAIAVCEEDHSSKPASILHRLSHFLDFSILASPSFIIYGMGCFLCMAGFFIPFTYLPKLTESMGYDKQQQAMSVSVIGITNVVSRVFVGWISDQPWADCVIINNLALMVGGIATALIPFCQNYVVLIIACILFGFSIAAFVSLRSIIMVELHGLEKLSSAFGMVTLCQGLSSFIGTPIAGALWDWTNNYISTFAMAGGALFLSGFICIPIRRIARWEHAKKKKEVIMRLNPLPE